MVEFVLSHWKNVHERRRLVTSKPLAQQNPSLCAGAVATHPEPDQDRSMRMQDQDMSSQDATMTEAGLEATQPSTDLSQHSLWSEQVEDVPIVNAASVRFAKPASLAHKEPVEEADSIVYVKAERAAVASTSKASESSLHDLSGGDDSPRINLNPKARKTGRSKVDVKQRALKKQRERTHFKAAQKVRRQTGSVTLEDVIDNIKVAWCDVHEAHRILAGVTVRFSNLEESKPTYSRMKNPVLNKDVFYLLREKLLLAFPVSTIAAPFYIDHNADEIPPHTEAAGILVVSIKGAGVFSRTKIYAMQSVALLKAQMSSAVETCIWLHDLVIPFVPVYQQGAFRNTIATITSTHPTTLLPGFKSTLPFYDDLASRFSIARSHRLS